MSLTLPSTLRHPLLRGSRGSTRGSLIALIAAWDSRRRARLHFATLDDRALADVGLTRDQQRTECAKPFWKL